MDNNEHPESDQQLKNEKVNATAVNALEKSIEDLPQSINTRLAEARFQALAQTKQKTSYQLDFSFLQKYAVPAFACIFAIAIFLNIGKETKIDDTLFADIQSLENFENFLIYSNTGETELAIIEDIEFAYWLSEELANDKNIPTDKELGV